MTEPTPLFHATAGEHAAYVEALLATTRRADITAAAEGARDGE
jgi:hypothetical protein